MGKIKAWMMDQQEKGLSGHFDYDESLIDYQMMIHEEENYKMTELEQHFYQLYMENKLCGEQENTVPTSTNTNLSSGQINTGEKSIPMLRKARSRK